jgi:hypothetical protein
VHVIVIVMSIFATLIHAPRATNTVVLHRYRRRDPTVFLLDPVPLPTVTPLKRTEHEQMQASVVLRGSNARTHTRIRNSCNSTARITRTPTRARTRARAHTHTHTHTHLTRTLTLSHSSLRTSLHLRYHHQRERAESANPSKKKKASVPPPPKSPHLKIGSIWDSNFDDGYGMTPKQQEREVRLRDSLTIFFLRTIHAATITHLSQRERLCYECMRVRKHRFALTFLHVPPPPPLPPSPLPRVDTAASYRQHQLLPCTCAHCNSCTSSTPYCALALPHCLLHSSGQKDAARGAEVKQSSRCDCDSACHSHTSPWAGIQAQHLERVIDCGAKSVML